MNGAPGAVETSEQQNTNLEFADSMHKKLQDLDLMLMKDKGVTTITKLVLQFDDRIRGDSDQTFAPRTRRRRWRTCPSR